ncbi:MAG: PKD domain-containing protein [Bacteroidota bacterium]
MMNRLHVLLAIILLAAARAGAQAPSASFTANTVSGCAPLTVQFNNTSVNALNYSWSFGNGNVSTLANPANVYTLPGTYTVKLFAYGANNTTDTAVYSNYIIVFPNPSASFTVSAPASCLDGNSFAFTNTSTGAATYLWDFGDGNTSTQQHPVHSYSASGIYTVKLIASNSNGCTDLHIVSNCVTIYPEPATSFTVNTNSACNPGQVFQFTNTTPSVTGLLWNFGDGNTSTAANPSHTYAANGNYSVSLITTNSNGCTDTLLQNNYISVGSPLPLFTSSVSSGCAPLNVSFACQNQNAIAWSWNLGDGNTSTQQNPAHTYTATGSFNVSLTVTLQGNCTSTLTQANMIATPPNAIPNFNWTVISPCNPYKVQFNNLSQGATSYLWEFGDGNTSTQANPVHIYTGSGSFNVKLHAYNSAGCDSVFQSPQPVVVSLASANFSSTQLTGCAPLTASFTNASVGTQWSWSFGDGTSSSLQNPVHSYVLPGSYTVKLFAYTQVGCVDSMIRTAYINVINPVSNYSAPPAITGCVPFTASFTDATHGAYAWSWDFGDGNTSTLQNPSHTYAVAGTYTVKLAIQVSNGCTQYYPSFRTIIAEGGAPQVSFSAPQCPPFNVSFSASAPNAVSWQWTFGDNSVSSQQNPAHTYLSPGLYSVTLTAITASGCMNTVVLSSAVNLNACNTNTGNNTGSGNTTVISSSSLSGCVPLNVSFTNILPGTTAWSWNFGDNSSSMQQNPTHTYTSAGIYSVTMIGYYPSGTPDTVYYTGHINAREVRAAFSVASISNCQNNIVALTDSSVNASAWSWNFGDYTTSSLQHPVHAYNGNNPTYHITLTASGQNGCLSSHTETYFQNPGNPVWANDYDACAGQNIAFTCAVNGYAAYSWNFGDGNVSAQINPTHAYAAAGTYTVTLTVTDANGCQRLFALPNQVVIRNPVADFTWAMNGSCNALSVGFTSLSTGISLPPQYNLKWNFGDNTPVLWANNPTHVYQAPGTYQVTLTAYTSSGCNSSITKTINVQMVSASFGMSQQGYCLPVTAIFTDSSVSAVSWYWNFGDGNTSTQQNPSHTFVSAPTGNVVLVVTDARGCSDTASKSNIQLFRTQFGMSATSGCNPSSVAFTDSSLNAVSWAWDFGDGFTSTQQNPQHTYTSNGTYLVTLVAQDASGCSDTTVRGPIVIQKPTAGFVSPGLANCAPSLVSFTDQSLGATAWSWDFGDGSFSTASNPSHIYNTPGTYTISLVVFNALGCSDTLVRPNYITVLGPLANFSFTSAGNCNSTPVQFTDLSAGAVSWSWNFGDGNVSSLQHPAHTYQLSGQFTVSLIVSDAQGCTASFASSNPVTISPASPPAASSILAATVTGNNSTYLAWIPSAASDFSHYTIFRKDPQTGSFVQAGQVYNQSNSVFSDSGSINTLHHSYCYKVQTTDLCGNALPLDSLAEHCTINVTAASAGAHISVSWNAYAGAVVGSYKVYRMEQGNSTPVLVATVPATTTAIIDSGIACPVHYAYRVKACNLNGNLIASNSDTSIARPAVHLFMNQQPAVVRSTVVDDQYILTEWTAPAQPQAVSSYNIYRSTDNISFALIATVPAQAFAYIDNDVNVQEQNYYYRVEAANACGPMGQMSNSGSSILLEAKRVDQEILLNWTAYEGWDTGVDYYIIEKMNEAGIWEVIRIVDGNVTETIDPNRE